MLQRRARVSRLLSESFGPQEECVTEQQWLAGATNPTWMVNDIRDKVSPRKLRLFAVACVRPLLPFARVPPFAGEAYRDQAARVIGIAERFAEGIALADELEAAYRESRPFMAPETDLVYAVHDACNPDARVAAVDITGSATRVAAGNWLDAHPGSRFCSPEASAAERSESVRQAALARCIFGNPFRPTTVAPGWLTWHDGVVRQIAQAIYDEAGFDRLAILADSLEEAGCTDEGWLAHCREAVVHGRGCWVVDLILGKA
jgi:hypothetical protein